MANTPVSPEASYVYLSINGERFDFWSDYQVTSDLMEGTDGFTFRAPVPASSMRERGNLTGRGLVPGALVKLHVRTKLGETLQMTGRIDEVSYDVSGDGGAVVTCMGRDHMAPLVDACAFPSVAMEGSTLKDIILAAVRNHGFTTSDILIDNDANRQFLTGKPARGVTLSKSAPTNLEAIKIDQAKPHAGETVFSFLTRHCRRNGLLIWGTADGKIVFGKPNYDQKSAYKFVCREGDAGVDNNVEHIQRRLSFKHRPSEIHVYGRSHGHDFTRTKIHAVVYDPDVRDAGYYRPLIVHDNNARTTAEAQRRGELELSLRLQGGDVISVLAAGHADVAGTVYAIDTMADVDFDAGGAKAAYYVARRVFSRNRAAGTTTAIELVARDSINLGDY